MKGRACAATGREPSDLGNWITAKWCQPTVLLQPSQAGTCPGNGI